MSKISGKIATRSIIANPGKQQIPPLRCAPVGMTISLPINHSSFNHCRYPKISHMGRYILADEHCAAVDVEDLAGDEAGEGGAEEEDRRGDLVDVRGAAQRDEGQQLLGRFGVAKDTGGHLSADPAGGDAVAVDGLADEFRGEALGEAEDSALGGVVVGGESVAAVSGGGRRAGHLYAYSSAAWW